MPKNNSDAVIVPQSARERLERQKESGRPPLYVTNFSPGDMLALRRSGVEPLGQVMGCSVYQVNAPSSSAVSGELKMLTGALLNVQKLALGRLREEAILLEADGVLGVRLQRHQIGPPDAPFQEWKVTGTAVRLTTGPRSTTPWLSGLSGTEYALLKQGGYRPVGLVLGNCAYYRVTDQKRVPAAIKTNNSYNAFAFSFERTEHSEAIATARSMALQRMEDEARSFGAEGIVGVTTEIERHNGLLTYYNLPDMFVHFFAMGTAIAVLPGRRDDVISPEMIVPL